MPYSKFRKITEVSKKFGLKLEQATLFPQVQQIAPSQYLTLSLSMAEQLGYATEKERSERLVSPILGELSHLHQGSLAIYSGRDLFVDDKLDLNGECDFLIALRKVTLDELIAPIIAIVEAKEQDLRYGMAQCAAQLYGARLFNENDGFKRDTFFGATTTGDVWRFLKLQGDTIYLDEKKYYIEKLEILLGVLDAMVTELKNN